MSDENKKTDEIIINNQIPHSVYKIGKIDIISSLNDILSMLRRSSHAAAFDLKYIKEHDINDLDKLIYSILYLHSPIIYKPGIPKNSIGTSIYVSYKKQKYIISAGHVFIEPSSRKHLPTKIDLSQIRVGNDIPLYEFKKVIIYPPQSDSSYFDMDYTVIFIDEEKARKLEEIYVPYTIKPLLDPFKIFYPENGFFFGYPSAKNKSNKFAKNQEVKPIVLHLFLDKIFTLYDKEKNHGRNIGFYYEPQVSTTQEIKEELTHTMCKLNGMSGCGIWSFPDYPINAPQNADSYALCGLFTSYHPEENRLIGFHLNDIISTIEYAEEYSSSIEKGIHVKFASGDLSV